MVFVTRVSQLSGKEAGMDLPLTQQELDEGLARSWSHCRAIGRGNGTEHMQDIFPQLSADQREFLMTGITPEEWSTAFGSEQ
jgi:hypothetical protein